MGKLVWIVGLLFLSGFVFSQEINKVDSKGRKQGVWQKTYPNSRAIEYKGQFKDDKPVGTFYYFYPSTKKKAIIIHDENSSRSVAYMYYESGVDLAYGIYRDQKKDSIWIYFGPSGKLSYTETYKEGELNGKRTIYIVPEDPNDKAQRVAMVEYYEKDVKHGDEIEYFIDGTVKCKGKYENGNRIGTFTCYHPNGARMTVENYKYGTLHGWCYGFDESGKELGRKYFNKGKELKGKELAKWLEYCKQNKINPNE